jgi:hypothetical protein
MPNSYEIHDWQQWVREHASIYFAGSEPTQDEMSRQIRDGIVALGIEEPLVLTHSSWSIVAAAQDWFPLGRYPLPQNMEFNGTPPFPELSQNSIRAESLLPIFAADIVVFNREGITFWKGKGNEIAEYFRATHSSYNWVKAVAFRGIGA